jgi:hypothetical protein
LISLTVEGKEEEGVEEEEGGEGEEEGGEREGGEEDEDEDDEEDMCYSAVEEDRNQRMMRGDARETKEKRTTLSATRTKYP